MNWTGVMLGLFSALVIGLGFVWVIRLEYLVGAHVWKGVALAGISVVALTAVIPDFAFAAALGVLGGSIVWGAVELPHQEERVDHGLFRAHPQRPNRRKVSGSGVGHGHNARPGLGKWWSF